jgi:hypothetical protein
LEDAAAFAVGGVWVEVAMRVNLLLRALDLIWWAYSVNTKCDPACGRSWIWIRCRGTGGFGTWQTRGRMNWHSLAVVKVPLPVWCVKYKALHIVSASQIRGHWRRIGAERANL